MDSLIAKLPESYFMFAAEIKTAKCLRLSYYCA